MEKLSIGMLFNGLAHLNPTDFHQVNSFNLTKAHKQLISENLSKILSSK